MTDQPPDGAALAHWAEYGRPGEGVSAAYVPGADDLARLHDFVAPETSSAIALRFDQAQAERLFAGYRPTVPDDKWIVYAASADGGRTASVFFHRSWTGDLIVRIDVVRGRTGWMLGSIAWETSDEVVSDGTVTSAVQRVLEICRWVLRMDPAPRLG